ncbi:hypothetical protein [Novosphingobium colocasiae]|uniref:hypothetical protein n=1 Tax=Novosphingobium colocasiae TaxID=1256513 RepID=UPI0035B0E56A
MGKSIATVLLLATAIGLSACGQRKDLALKPGMKAPPAPYGRSAALNPAEALAPPTVAIPERSTELRTRSEEREDDPFDLPPPE